MAIDAQKLTEKDELISQFYALRAGMSAISLENDKIRSAQQEIKELNQKEEDNKRKTEKDFDDFERGKSEQSKNWR